jgi:CheY-like chemotaxis protein
MKRILIVDDKPVNLISLSHLLKNKYTVSVASSCLEDA